MAFACFEGRDAWKWASDGLALGLTVTSGPPIIHAATLSPGVAARSFTCHHKKRCRYSESSVSQSHGWGHFDE